MPALDHYRNLERVAHYQAPDHMAITPVRIPEEHELVELITGGGVWFGVDGSDRECGAGTIFWHRAGDMTIHRSLPGQPYRCMCFAFRVAEGAARAAPRVSVWPDARAAVDFCWDAFNVFQSGQWDGATLGLMLYTRLLWEGRRGAPAARPAVPEAVLRAMTCIERRVQEDLRVEDLAREAEVSVPHLHALFRKHLGTSPHRAALERRLVHARTLLATTAQPIKAVGLACGFANVETFCRAFRRQFGIPPGEMRRREQTTP